MLKNLRKKKKEALERFFFFFQPFVYTLCVQQEVGELQNPAGTEMLYSGFD